MCHDVLSAAATMLAAGAVQPGGPPPTAAAVKAAKELRAHMARDDAWHSLLTDLLGPANDAAIVEYVAAALTAIGRDIAAARALLKCYSDVYDSKELRGKLQKLLLAASAVAAKHRSKVAHGAELVANFQMQTHVPSLG